MSLHLDVAKLSNWAVANPFPFNVILLLPHSLILVPQDVLSPCPFDLYLFIYIYMFHCTQVSELYLSYISFSLSFMLLSCQHFGKFCWGLKAPSMALTTQNWGSWMLSFPSLWCPLCSFDYFIVPSSFLRDVIVFHET